MGRIEGDGVQRRVVHQPQPKVEPKIKPEERVNNDSRTTRIGDLQLQGQQKRDRIERLYGANAASVSMMNDISLIRATAKADNAHRQTFDRELTAFEAYKKSGAADPSYTGAKSYIEVSQRADAAYRNTLQEAGFRPADVHGNSTVKALDFLNAEANRPGSLSTLSADQVRGRVQAGGKPTYLVRLVENRYISSGDSKLSGKDTAWVATADEIAGAKGDLFETMRRIGYKDDYVAQVRQNVEDSKNGVLKPGDKNYTRVEDYSLAVMETDGTKGRTRAFWDTILGKAKVDDRFRDYNFNKPELTESVKNFRYDGKDYDTHRSIMDAKGIKTADDYTVGFPKQEKEAFKARFDIESKYGANQIYTGDGTTLRDDGRNRGVGGQELFIDTVPLKEQPRTSFMPMRDTGLSDGSATLEVRPKINNVVDVPQATTMRGEIKGGSIAGAGISAAFSLPQVFDQARRGDYKGAATTFAVDSGTGAVIGGVSAAGERIVGRGIETALTRSNLVSNGLERLYTNGAARNVVGRLAQTEASTMTSQTFGTALRTVGGRIGGAGVIGGLVSGGFSAYDQIGAYRRGEVRGAEAFGTVVGETAVGVGAGAAGAAAGAAIGVWFGGVGAVPGAIIGFGVGLAADKVMRMGGVDKAIAKGVTATIDAGARAAGAVRKSAGQAVRAGRQFVGRQITQARAVYQSASSAVSSARTFVSQRVSQTRQAISSGTRAAVNYVSQTGSRAVAAVRNTASQAVNQVRSTVGNVANQVSSTVSSVANQARSTVSNAVNNMASGAVSNLRSVFGW